MEIGLLVLRVVVGLLMAGHGAQKLFGKFGGHGIDGTGAFFESLGLQPGRRNAIAAGSAELAGGLLLALGLLTPLAAALIVAVMVTAIITVHGSKGPWVTESGFEYTLVLIAVAFAVTATGPGDVSADGALGLASDLSGAGWAIGALALGVLGGVGAVVTARAGAAPEPATDPAMELDVDVAPGRRFARDPETVYDAERPGVPADPPR